MPDRRAREAELDVDAALVAPCAPEELFALVDDLSVYPQWTDLVRRAEPDPVEAATWFIELRAQVGRLARSKRLRMVRVERDVENRSVIFERRELDGRAHAAWILHAEVGDGPPTELRVRLHYGGRLWTGGVLERVLADSIVNGRERLLTLVEPTR